MHDSDESATRQAILEALAASDSDGDNVLSKDNTIKSNRLAQLEESQRAREEERNAVLMLR